jgi:hypothetical protein
LNNLFFFKQKEQQDAHIFQFAYTQILETAANENLPLGPYQSNNNLPRKTVNLKPQIILFVISHNNSVR